MGTILKYIFYIALIIIIYLVGKGIFEGSINETTTVGQVVDDVKSGAADMAKKAVEDTKSDSRNVAVPAKSSNQGAYNSTQGEFMMSENTLSDKAANAWDKTKEVSSDAWEATKEGTKKAGEAIAEKSGDAWEATKEGTKKAGEAVAEKSGDAWEATKDVSGKAWDKTKEVSGDAWEATKEGAHNLKEKVTDTPDDAAYHVRQNDAAVQSEQRADY